jgi:hypothetical protein
MYLKKILFYYYYYKNALPEIGKSNIRNIRMHSHAFPRQENKKPKKGKLIH